MSVYSYNRLHAQERTASKVYNKAKRMFAHHLVFLALGMAWVCAPSTFFPEHPRFILLTIGMLFGYQVVSRNAAPPGGCGSGSGFEDLTVRVAGRAQDLVAFLCSSPHVLNLSPSLFSLLRCLPSFLPSLV